jgi:hypothetical protein
MSRLNSSFVVSTYDIKAFIPSIKPLFIIFCFCFTYSPCKSRGSSVGIALGYGLDDRRSRVRIPAGTGNFSLHHRFQNGSGTHPASYPMGTEGSFPGGKDSDSPNAEVKE